MIRYETDRADDLADAECAEDPAEDLWTLAVALEHEHRKRHGERAPDDVDPGEREHPRTEQAVAEQEPHAVHHAARSSEPSCGA